MTTRQNNKQNMYLVVNAFLSESASVWNSVPGIVSAVDRLHTLLDEISRQVRIQITPTTGIAKQKKNVKIQLIETLVAVAGAIQSIADDNNDHELFQNMHYTPGILRIKSTIKTASIANIVYKKALTLTPELLDKGITASTLTHFHSLIQQFDNLGQAPRAAKAERKSATQNVKTLIHQTDSFLKNNLDNLMLQFAVSNKEFYSKYRNNRNIIDLGTRHRHPESTENQTGNATT
ncbi:MAG: hypothetical protein POELPBGB_00880 [Bacteroidia bacterium]|nr:hypothetical protein [Bacteroidia bacterium]